MIKYLYVLVSNEADYYLEQLLMSITSLRIHTPDAFVSLLIDDTTEEGLKDKRKNILNLVNELKSIKIDSRFNKKARSRWLKTSMRKHIEGDFLFIDCDTIISEDLSDIENLNMDLGAALDGHAPWQDLHAKDNNQNVDKMLGFSASFTSDKCFNSGVIFCRDISICHKFFDEWHGLWLYCFEKGVLIDQPSFNQVILLMGNSVIELDGKWNCQILAIGMLKYLHIAKIIHYFSSIQKKKHPYLLANQDVFEKVKKTIVINQEIKNMLMNPRYLFFSRSYWVVKDKFDYSVTYIVARKIFNSRFGSCIELLASYVGKSLHKLLH